MRHGSLVLTPPQGRAGFRAARDRFLREARVLARFTHPGIVRVYEVFEEHGTAYLVMELLDGRTLIDLLQARGRPFPEDEVLDVAARGAAALRPIHAAGVLHRDINPSNVMLTHHGRIVLIDFGLARDFSPDQTVGMTRVVTPGYAPLEQYRGEARFGPSTDVYGLAATCYRLATGKVPVSALERDGGAILPSPRSINPAISKPVSDALLDGLELEPSHRPQDLDAFLARLGIRRLPDTPRSILLDAAPPPTPRRPAADPSQPVVAPAPVPQGALAAAALPAPPVPRGGDPLVVSGASPRPPGYEPTARRSDGHPPIDPDADLTSATEIVARPTAARATVLASGEPGHTVVERTAGAGAGAGGDTRGADPAGRPGEATAWAPAAPDATRPAHGRDPGPSPDATRSADGRTPGSGPDATRPASDADRPRPLLVAAPVAAAAPAPALHRSPEPSARPAPLAVGQAADPRLPLAVGPHRPGRRKLTVPLLIVTLAVGTAAPVLVTALLVVVLLPALATLGDSVSHRLRAEHGIGRGWAEKRLAPGALAPARFVANVVVSVVRNSPWIGIGAVLLVGWFGLEGLSTPVWALDLALRGLGLVVVGLVVATGRSGSHRFRTAIGLDELVARFVPEGRTTERLVIAWVIGVALVAAALWLSPDTFPIP